MSCTETEVVFNTWNGLGGISITVVVVFIHTVRTYIHTSGPFTVSWTVEVNIRHLDHVMTVHLGSTHTKNPGKDPSIKPKGKALLIIITQANQTDAWVVSDCGQRTHTHAHTPQQERVARAKMEGVGHTNDDKLMVKSKLASAFYKLCDRQHIGALTSWPCCLSMKYATIKC